MDQSKMLLDDHVAYDGPFEAFPALYLGDKALGQTYYIEGVCDPEVEGTFRYAASAYTEELANPRIIRRDVTPPGDNLDGADICLLSRSSSTLRRPSHLC